MATEIEMKLALLEDVSPNRLNSILCRLCKNVSEGATKQLNNTYFDTPDWALNRHQIALRIRDTGDTWIQTLKTKGQSSDGMHKRGEWEWPLKRPRLESTLLEELEAWPSSIDASYLTSCFSTNFVRHRFDLTFESSAIECVLDEGQVESDTSDNLWHILEIELELKYGNVRALQSLAKQLSAELALVPDNISKAQRGYEIAKQERHFSQRIETFVRTFLSEDVEINAESKTQLAQFLINTRQLALFGKDKFEYYANDMQEMLCKPLKNKDIFQSLCNAAKQFDALLDSELVTMCTKNEHVFCKNASFDDLILRMRDLHWGQALMCFD